MSLANVLAVSQAAQNVVMLGDPQQLEQPVKHASGDGGQISGSAGTGSHLLFDDLIAGRCAARNGISLQPEPTQRRNVARSGRSDRRRQPSSSGARVPQPTTNAVGKCPLPLRRNRPSRRDAIIGAKRRVPLLIQRDIFL
jgi:hypothetical protein